MEMNNMLQSDSVLLLLRHAAHEGDSIITLLNTSKLLVVHDSD